MGLKSSKGPNISDEFLTRCSRETQAELYGKAR